MDIRYTNTLQLDYDCNYLDPEKSNSSDFILSCINKPNTKNPLHYDQCLNTSIDVQEDTMEGFSNDHSSKGPGVSYTPKGTCHDGYSRDKDGYCNIQVFRGRVRDGAWQRGHHNETMHDGKENYQICGKDNFLGLSNGYLLCDKKEEEEGVIEKIVEIDEEVDEEVEVLPYDTIETFSNI